MSRAVLVAVVVGVVVVGGVIFAVGGGGGDRKAAIGSKSETAHEAPEARKPVELPAARVGVELVTSIRKPVVNRNA